MRGPRRSRRSERSTSALVALVLVPGSVAAWSWQPATPRADGVRATTVGLQVGQSVALPELGPDASVTLESVDGVCSCAGRWWPGFGTLFSGPVTQLTVTAHGVPDPVGVAPQDSWVAVNGWGEAYTGGSACECDGSCEASPRDAPGGRGVTYTVLLETGGTFSAVGFTGAPGRYLEWDV